MAQNLQVLKRRIKTAQNIAQVARAMEMIAASKIKKAQSAVVNNKPYAEKIIAQTKNIVENIDKDSFSHPYLEKEKSQKTLMVILSPDKGLCGSLVTNITRKFLAIHNKENIYITVGKKMERFVSRMSNNLIASFPMGTTLPSFGAIFPIIELINQLYEKAEIGRVEILYPEFKSLFLQAPKVDRLLPIAIEEEQQQEHQLVYIVEPDIKTILSSLLPYYLEVVLYSRFIEAFTSEQAARMLAMQNAKNNALDISDYLTLLYNKSRQEKITNELLDLSNSQFV